MKMLHFVDVATTDETLIMSSKIHKISVVSANSVEVMFDGPASVAGFTDVEFDKVVLTAAAKSHVVALRLAEHMVATNVGGPSVLSIKAATAPFNEVSAVAYTLGV